MENFILVVLGVMFVAGSPLVASLKLRPPPGYEPVLGGPGFLKLHREPLDWYDALVTCRLEGGTLASPLNSVITYSLLNLTWGLPGTHVGVRALEGQTYFTIEGVELSKIERWANWAVVVPLGTERCMILRPDGTLKAFRCNKKHPYVCFRNITDFNKQGFNECGTLDDGYQLYQSTGTCYKLHKIGMPWARAVLSCQSEGGSLLIIKSEIEAEIASNIAFVPTTTVYIPLYSSYWTSYSSAWVEKIWYGNETMWVSSNYRDIYGNWQKQYDRRPIWKSYWSWFYSTRTYISTKLVNPSTTTPPHPYFDQEIFLGLYRTGTRDFLTIHGVPYNEMKGYREFHPSVNKDTNNYLCGGYWPRNMKIYGLRCDHFHRYICEKKP